MFCSFDQFSEIFATCQRSKVGKLLPDALNVQLVTVQYNNGRYWFRTSDLFRVKEARYHCANRPRLLNLA